MLSAKLDLQELKQEAAEIGSAVVSTVKDVSTTISNTVEDLFSSIPKADNNADK